jgi:hypothetical protein
VDPGPRAGPPARSDATRVGLLAAATVVVLGVAAVAAGWFVIRPLPEAAFVPARSPSPSASCGPWGCGQDQRFAAASSFISQHQGYLGIVVRDRRTGAVWRAGAVDHLTWAASTVKLAMTVALLESARVGQVTLDGTARQQIADMLNWSSDKAADALWDRYGGESLAARFGPKYGMTRLAFQAGFPHRWGHMKCTPDDLAALMGYILDRLLPDDRSYLVNAMRGVGPVQRWGVWGAGPQLRPGNKDGWSVEPDGGSRHWVADTVGFAGPDERYLVAAMYHVPPSAGTAAAGIHLGAHVVSDLVATVFGATVPAAVSVPDHE